MLYNAQRRRVREWQAGEISTCPDCQQSLIARRGELKIWHWAHYPIERSGGGHICEHRESAWHLAWKTAYDQLPDWQIELSLNGYRADAVNLKTRQLREFIHCLSPYYSNKHRIFSSLRFDTRWLFDGETFGSKRNRQVRGSGIKRLLKPRAYALHLELQKRCWVHWNGQIWEEWQNNVWYARHDRYGLISQFERAQREYGIFPAGRISEEQNKNGSGHEPEPLHHV